MPYQTTPKRYPGDRIRSAEWNIIINNQDYHETRINQAYDILGDHEKRITTLEQIATPSLIIIGFGEADWSINYNVITTHLPYSSAKDGANGMPLPTSLTLKKFIVYVSSNTLNNNCMVSIRKNETVLTTTQIIIPPGQTGLFTIDINEDFAEGDRLDFNVDTTPSITGSITIAGMSVKASIPPPAYY